MHVIVLCFYDVCLFVCLLQDLRVVHMRFIDECFRRLADLTDTSGGSGGGSGRGSGPSPSRTSSGHITDPELRLQAIERLLLLAQRYISAVEASFPPLS